MFMFFNKVSCSNHKQFKVSTCESLLKKIIIDAKPLIRTKINRKNAIRKEIFNLLTDHQLNDAHILVEYLIHQYNLIKLLAHIQFLCEQIADLLMCIEFQREVPLEVKQAIASLCYVGSCYNELPALEMVLSQFSLKYGEEYIVKVNKFKEDCDVQKEVVEWLSVPKPTVEERNKLIKEIADQFKFDWVPVSVLDTASSAYEDPMSNIETHTMLMLLNKIPCSNNKQFKASTCKTLLEKTIVDAQSLITTKGDQMDGMQEDIFYLLMNQQKSDAYTLVEDLIYQKNLCLVLQHVTYFCQRVARHLPYIESQRKLLPEVMEPIASLCYVGSRYNELPALKMLLSQFSLKYGEDYIFKVNMLQEDGVKEQIISLFIPKPLVEERNKLVKEIANRFELNKKLVQLVEEQNKHTKEIANQFGSHWDFH